MEPVRDKPAHGQQDHRGATGERQPFALPLNPLAIGEFCWGLVRHGRNPSQQNLALRHSLVNDRRNEAVSGARDGLNETG
jgi:hypothetical protein